MTISRFSICNLRFTPLFRRSVVVLFLFLFVAQCEPAFAADIPATEEIPGRYLVIVETSSSMRKRIENTQNAVEKLLFTGMNGQLHKGDEIGVWTFNESLYTGRLPLQHWDSEKRQDITTDIGKFLRTQAYEKEGRLSAILPDLFHVIAESRRITVILVTSGEVQISGTPFDDKINFSYAQSRDVLQKQRKPFVTVLRAQHGRWTGCSVSWSPWPVEFPMFPPEPVLVENKKDDAKVQPPAETKTETRKPKPLIIIGKKPEPVAPASVTPVEEQKEPTPAPQNEADSNLKAPTVELPALQNEIAPKTAGETKQTAQSPVPAEAVAASSEPAPVASAKPETKVEEPRTMVAERSPEKLQPAVSQPVEQAPQISEPEPVSKASSPPTESVEPVVVESQPSTQPIQVAAAVPSEAKSNRTILLLAGGAALIGAFILAFLLMRKQRTNASLITRSMEQDK